MNKEERHIVKVRSAYLFYIKELTKREIAKRLGYSRPTILNLLKQAKEEGIVRIEIIDKSKNVNFELEEKIKEKYKLKDIKIIKNDLNLTGLKLKEKLGKESSFYCEKYIKSNSKIGISWGSTLKHMIDNLKENKEIKNLEIIALLGGFSNMGEEVNASILCGKMLKLYYGKEYLLFSPAMLENNKYNELFLLNDEIKQVLTKINSLDIAFIGIGTMSSNSALLKNKAFDQNEISELKRRGAVGNICCQFYDIQGNLINLKNKKVVGTTLENLKKVKRTIALAGGIEKVPAILGALNGHLINELITDDITAKALLNY